MVCEIVFVKYQSKNDGDGDDDKKVGDDKSVWWGASPPGNLLGNNAPALPFIHQHHDNHHYLL